MYIYLVCKIDVAARSNQQRRHAFMPVSRRSVQSSFSILFFLILSYMYMQQPAPPPPRRSVAQRRRGVQVLHLLMQTSGTQFNCCFSLNFTC